MGKKGFVNIKKADKVWSKVFSEKQISAIWDMFKAHFNEIANKEIDWEKDCYLEYISGDYTGNKFPVYPETDIYDDSEGIQPKQMKRLLSVLDLHGAFIFFRGMAEVSKSYCAQSNDYWDNEDQIISWEEIFKTHIDPILKSEQSEEEKRIALGKIYFDARILNKPIGHNRFSGEQRNIPYHDIDNGVYYHMLPTEKEAEEGICIFAEDILEFSKLKPVPVSTKITKEIILNVDSYFEDIRSDWKKIHGFIPQDRRVLLLNPKYWHKKVFLDSMHYMFGTRQIRNLSEEKAVFFIGLYKSFGLYLPFVLNTIKNEKLSSLPSSFVDLYEMHEEVNPAFKKIFESLAKGIDLMLSSTDLFNLVASMHIDSTEKVISTKTRLSVRDINAMTFAGKFVVKLISSNKDIAKDIPFEHLSQFEKYRISERDMNEVLKLYSQTKDIKVKTIPLLSGTVDGYHYEMLPKSDLRGLIAGNATNCCQHVSGQAKSCVYQGSKTEDNAVFIITKDDKIIAQSFVWVVKDQLTFDSIEFLGGNNSKQVAECYKEYSTRALEESKILKTITCGSKGRLHNSSESNSWKTASNTHSAPSGLYTDARTQYLIAKK